MGTQGQSQDRLGRRGHVHVLHVGKTGGTALKAALAPHVSGPRYTLTLHEHRTTLRDVPVGHGFLFVVRDPVARFVSAFNSRRREGRPRFHYPWSEEERAAFGRFRVANELGCALASGDGATQADAERALRTIRHVSTSYWDWFEDEAYLRSRADDLFFIGRLETLDADFERLRSSLGLPRTAVLPRDAVAAHRSPAAADRHLDPDARRALALWYARDYAFLELCRTLQDRTVRPRG